MRSAEIGFASLLGELAVGLVYGLALALLNEMLLFAGQIAGLQFSFSLVNLMDPASSIQTPLLGELFQLMGTLVVLAAGLDRILLASLVRSFRAVPAGELCDGARRRYGAGAGGERDFLAAVELAAPVLAATLLVEIAVSLMGKLSPQLPVMSSTVPIKTVTGFAMLMGSLALWPRFIEARFAGLLDLAEKLIAATRGREDSDARRAHRTGNTAPPRKGAQGRRPPAQPGTLGRGRHPGGGDGARAFLRRTVESWREGSALSRLGGAGTGSLRRSNQRFLPFGAHALGSGACRRW